MVPIRRVGHINCVRSFSRTFLAEKKECAAITKLIEIFRSKENLIKEIAVFAAAVVLGVGEAEVEFAKRLEGGRRNTFRASEAFGWILPRMPIMRKSVGTLGRGPETAAGRR